MATGRKSFKNTTHSDDHDKKGKKDKKKNKKVHQHVAAIAPTEEANPPLSAANQRHLENIERIQHELEEMKTPGLDISDAMSKILELKSLIRSNANAFTIAPKVDGLDQAVLQLRRQAVEVGKAAVADGIQDILKRTENVNDLQARADELSLHANEAFGRKPAQPAKKKGFSLFSCFPCCGGDNTDEPERKPLLRK